MKTDKKVKALLRLICRLKNRKQVKTREIAKVLTKEQIKEIEEHWNYQKSLDLIKRPYAIKRYAEMIRIACLHYSKMEKYHQPPKNSILSKKYSDKAESQFEQALEFIREASQSDPELKIWIDRDLNNVTSYCPVGIPRVIGSDSAECHNKSKQPYPRLSKRQLLIEALESAVYELQNHTFDEFMVDEVVCLAAKRKALVDYSEFKY